MKARFTLIMLVVVGLIGKSYIEGFWLDTTNTLEVNKNKIAEGADPNAFDEFGKTPLMIAVSQGEYDLANVLLQAGALVNLQSGADQDIGDSVGNTALHFAAINAYPELINLLIRNNADTFFVNKEWQTPLHLTCFMTDEGQRKLAIDALIAASVDINAQNYEGNTALFLYADQNGGETIDYMLSKYGNFLNLSLRNKDGSTVVEHVMKLQREAVWPQLNAFKNTVIGLDETKPVNDTDSQGYAGLHLAAVQGNVDYARRLLARGADVALKSPAGKQNFDVGGNTPAHFALKYNKVEVAELLFGNKAPCGVVNNAGETLLMAALGIRNLNQRFGFIKRLVACGAQVNAQDANGNTLMHRAVMRRDVQFITRFLNGYGAMVDRTIKNAQGFTFEQLAQQLKVPIKE